MLLVADVTAGQRIEPAGATNATGIDLLQQLRSTIPAVTHVDHSARVQTVTERENPGYHRLLVAFERATGCPVLVNTSFNVRGEPIVRSPQDAYTCFMRTDIDLLAMGTFLLDKQLQPQWSENADWREVIPLD
jgi:carbamoyltransferase